MVNLPSSPIDRFFSRPRPLWITAIFCLLLIGLPPVAAWMDGIWTDYISHGFWRISLVAPVEIIYIIVIVPILAHSDDSVIEVFRSRMGIDNDSFNQFVYDSARINPVVEAVTISVGGMLGLLTAYSWNLGADAIRLNIAMHILLAFMYALLAWVILGAIAGTRFISALHRRPIQFDLFDIKPFEPIGKQSLTLAMVFIGGITLAVVFSIQVESILNPFFWLANIPFVLVAILVFYLGMRPTHLLFEAKKNGELEKIRLSILGVCRRMAEGFDREEDISAISSQINALAIYEKHLQEVRTWPYNFSMLRTLFFSVLIPGFTMLARLVADLFRD